MTIEDLPEAQAMLALSGVRRIAVIMVNAPGAAGERISRTPEPPGVMDVASLSGSALSDLYGQENRALLREQLSRMTSPPAATATTASTSKPTGSTQPRCRFRPRPSKQASRHSHGLRGEASARGVTAVHRSAAAGCQSGLQEAVE